MGIFFRVCEALQRRWGKQPNEKRKAPRKALASVGGYEANYFICSALNLSRPFLAARLGWFEAYALGYWDENGQLNDSLRRKMWNTPGIFPPTEEQFLLFRKEYLDAAAQADLLGTLGSPYEEEVLLKYAPSAVTTDLANLEPYFCCLPWSRVLAGKRVLVVHPFARSIADQYHQFRDVLFASPDILPQFDLQTLAPPQTMCGNTDGYGSWHEALTSLRKRVLQERFDVAIIGCGSYGLPLAASVKQSGRAAIHLGGATQILFGILGRRWEGNARFRVLFNDFWRRPSENERPPNYEEAENGCYW